MPSRSGAAGARAFPSARAADYRPFGPVLLYETLSPTTSGRDLSIPLTRRTCRIPVQSVHKRFTYAGCTVPSSEVFRFVSGVQLTKTAYPR